MPVAERLPEPSNLLGIDGIEFIEYATSQAQAFAAVDDYRQLPLQVVTERARRSVKWITGRVSRRSLPSRRAAPRHQQ